MNWSGIVGDESIPRAVPRAVEAAERLGAGAGARHAWARAMHEAGRHGMQLDEHMRLVVAEGAIVAAMRRHAITEIPCVRVSSAQARGLAGRYPYWGAVRYVLRLRARDGRPTLYPQGRASSDRRSMRLAHIDAERIARREGRIVVAGGMGALRLDDAIALRQAAEQ
jgi:hypothetical protein